MKLSELLDVLAYGTRVRMYGIPDMFPPNVEGFQVDSPERCSDGFVSIDEVRGLTCDEIEVETVGYGWGWLEIEVKG